jgi:hypothetical protein
MGAIRHHIIVTVPLELRSFFWLNFPTLSAVTLVCCNPYATELGHGKMVVSVKSLKEIHTKKIQATEK